jgi:ArsR family transcriptional regulator, arsenate/arsenite/antimonite-responsive transcriptional repressor
MDTTQTVQALRALSHDVRLAAYRALIQAGPGGMPVGSLRDLLNLPAATLTAHLNQLRQAGLVTDQREGRVIRLRADYERMNALIAFLTENCCKGQSCSPAGCEKQPDADKADAE